MSEAIPVVDLLEKRTIKVVSRCQICGKEGESVNHVVFTCSLARQTWALSCFPSLEGGFDEMSLFSNFHYLILSTKSKKIPKEISRIFPWIIWYLWKNINGLFFEGKVFLASEVVAKANEEAEDWFIAHTHDKQEELNIPKRKPWAKKNWKRPPDPWLKCNVGYEWSSDQKSCGAAWILRNQTGMTVLHSRRSFPNIESEDEAKFQVHSWAFKSMVEHRVRRVIFGTSVSEYVNAMARPIAWPSFSWHVEEFSLILNMIEEWKMEIEIAHSNKGAWLIAHSVIKDQRNQSYVARGAPVWLRIFLDQEA